MGRTRAGASGGKETETTSRRRRLRERPTPRWLVKRSDLDPIAQRRCLLVLSVLSGEKAVTEAIAASGISRGTYYQLESKALVAMLAALSPGSEAAATVDGASWSQRVAELEAKVGRLEQEKRRVERLLYLARKVVPAGPVALPRRGRPPGSKNRVSKLAGRRPSPSSSTTKTATPGPEASTPTPGGATTP